MSEQTDISSYQPNKMELMELTFSTTTPEVGDTHIDLLRKLLYVTAKSASELTVLKQDLRDILTELRAILTELRTKQHLNTP